MLAHLLFLPLHDQPLSIDLTLDSQSLLEPSPSDPVMRLDSLTIKECKVSFVTLVDILVVCPRVQHLTPVALSSIVPSHWAMPARKISQDEFLKFLPKACPDFLKVNYSNDGTRVGEAGAGRLILENRNVTEWSFVQLDIAPALGLTLFHVRKVITYLEIALALNPGTDLQITWSYTTS